MDPNKTLEEMRALVERIHEELDEDATTSAEELALLVTSLDEWLTRGGFLPDAWASQRDTQPTPEEG